jgi:hypothetical protein
MIPSLINLAIGGMAFTRGVPGVSRLLLRWIPEGREVPDYRRPLAALALTGQMFAGAVLGIVAQTLLAWGLVFHVMPAIGLDLLWLCEQLANFNLPSQLYNLFTSARYDGLPAKAALACRSWSSDTMSLGAISDCECA